MPGPEIPPDLPPAAQKVLSPDAPAPLRMMAARGILPGAKPADMVAVVALLSVFEDEAVATQARSTLGKLPPPVLDNALGQTLSQHTIHCLAQAFAENADVVEKLLRQPQIGEEAIGLLADRASERIGELIATNEELMLRFPTTIEKLYMNKSVRMSTADRLIELAVRNGLELTIPAFKEAAQAIRDELIAEPMAERSFDDELFIETDVVAQETVTRADDEDTHEVDDEGEEQLREKFVPLYARIAQMTVTQKIRRATLGTGAERLLLVRDTNRLVCAAAAKSPMLKENEAVVISASRSVSDEVLRILANNREFTRNYQIKLNLVTNPRTPFTFVARIIPHLRESDLKALARSKNVTGSVASAIKQQMGRKAQKH